MGPEFKKILSFRFRGSLPLLSRHLKWIFVTLFFAAFGAGMYDFYLNVYRGDWTDAEKQRYAETAFSETVLREAEFRAAVSSVSERAASYAKDVRAENDLFRRIPVPGSSRQPASTGR